MNHGLRSFLNIDADSHFSIQNLPFGIFSRSLGDPAALSVGVAIGDYVLDLNSLTRKAPKIFEPELTFDEAYQIFSASCLNPFMVRGRQTWRHVRNVLTYILLHPGVESGSFSSFCSIFQGLPQLHSDKDLREQVLVEMKDVQMHLPVNIGDYTDFYASKEHATNVGIMFRGKENALNPNWVHLPIAYHGRSSSIVVSGSPITRPTGQVVGAAPAVPVQPELCPSLKLDFELEMGFFVGRGNKRGHPIPIDQCEEHIFGMVLVNDWSARDIQKWEYFPLGPFGGKNFATTISPWVVTMEALQDFVVNAPVQDPPVLAYLQEQNRRTFDICLTVDIETECMRQALRISESNFKYLYWTPNQMLAHHTITGCNMRCGDLLASGTISGPTPLNLGSMLEMSWSGTRCLNLPSGKKRYFLEDGDRIIISGYCQGNGYRVGFGQCTGQVMPTTQSLIGEEEKID